MINIIWNFVVEQLQHNQFFSGAALSGAFMGIIYKLKSVPSTIYYRVRRLLFFTIEIDSDVEGVPIRPYKAINNWIAENYSHKIRSAEVTTTATEKNAQLNDYFYIWHKGRYIKITSTKKERQIVSEGAPFSRKHIFSGWAAKKQITELIANIQKEELRKYNERIDKKKSILVFVNRGSYENQWVPLNAKTTNKKFEDIFLEQKQLLLDDIQKYKDSAPLYERLKIPRKRGYLFYGQPGNGKSSIAYAIAAELKYDLYILNLNTTEENFETRMARIPHNAVVVIEDIDSFYNLREPIGKNEISFSVFLNALSGVAAKDNIVTILTTNNIDAIDPALVRAGRCDVKVELKNPSKEIAEQYLKHVYQQPMKLQEDPNMSFANLQNLVLENIESPQNLLNALGTTN